MSDFDPMEIAMELLEEDCDTTDGVCKACGSIQGNCEPDAQNYTCENCGKSEVFGAAEIVLCG